MAFSSSCNGGRTIAVVCALSSCWHPNIFACWANVVSLIRPSCPPEKSPTGTRNWGCLVGSLTRRRLRLRCRPIIASSCKISLRNDPRLVHLLQRGMCRISLAFLYMSPLLCVQGGFSSTVCWLRWVCRAYLPELILVFVRPTSGNPSSWGPSCKGTSSVGGGLLRMGWTRAEEPRRLRCIICLNAPPNVLCFRMHPKPLSGVSALNLGYTGDTILTPGDNLAFGGRASQLQAKTIYRLTSSNC